MLTDRDLMILKIRSAIIHLQERMDENTKIIEENKRIILRCEIITLVIYDLVACYTCYLILIGDLSSVLRLAIGWLAGGLIGRLLLKLRDWLAKNE
jgi:hypothetical protein